MMEGSRFVASVLDENVSTAALSSLGSLDSWMVLVFHPLIHNPLSV
jgi:hypothetical protein